MISVNTNDYIGKILTREEIFDTFIEQAVCGRADSSNYPEVKIDIEFIGSREEAEKYQESHHKCAICYGKHKRLYSEQTGNCKFNLEDIVGIWHTNPVDFGGQSDEMLLFLPDGLGIFAEANFGPYFASDITWYGEDDKLIIELCDSGINDEDCLYQKSVEVQDISYNVYDFPSIEVRWGGTYFKVHFEYDITLSQYCEFVKEYGMCNYIGNESIQ